MCMRLEKSGKWEPNEIERIAFKFMFYDPIRDAPIGWKSPKPDRSNWGDPFVGDNPPMPEWIRTPYQEIDVRADKWPVLAAEGPPDFDHNGWTYNGEDDVPTYTLDGGAIHCFTRIPYGVRCLIERGYGIWPTEAPCKNYGYVLQLWLVLGRSIVAIDYRDEEIAFREVEFIRPVTTIFTHDWMPGENTTKIKIIKHIGGVPDLVL